MGIRLEKLFPGKLDNEFLSELIKKYTTTNESVVVGPGIGRDATVIEFGEKYLIAKTDPITFTTDHIGYYAVHINANDVVCMGAEPEWFLATILLPEKKSTKAMVENIFEQISKTCKKEKILFCGGHTEVTTNLDKVIIVGILVGQAEKDQLIQYRNTKVGDHIVLVREVPIEATAIIAKERFKDLVGVYSKEFVQKCQNLLYDPGISVRKYAQIARKNNAHTMHDPTEGGLATALHELAQASGLGLRIMADSIPILPEGKLLCDQFQLNPLGCIASGSLLITTSEKDVKKTISAFEAEGIVAADIGVITPSSSGTILVTRNKERLLPRFDQDEIAKIF